MKLGTECRGPRRLWRLVDRVQAINVRDWSNATSINAAVAVASQKWEALTINGTDGV
jgi:hypothetical protein